MLARLGRGETPLSHEGLDALNTPGNGGTANHLDAVLTAAGVLPPRDLELARLERSLATAVDAVADDGHRKILRSYATWQLLRRAREQSRQQPLTAAARHTATTCLAAATHLLGWLADRGTELAGVHQLVLDAYLNEHQSRRRYLPGFLTWAHRTRRARRLELARVDRSPKAVAAGGDQRWALARALLHDDGYVSADRVAGLLVLLFGQRPHRISRLTTSNVTIQDGRATLLLGTSPITAPEPLARGLRTAGPRPCAGGRPRPPPPASRPQRQTKRGPPGPSQLS